MTAASNTDRASLVNEVHDAQLAYMRTVVAELAPIIAAIARARKAGVSKSTILSALRLVGVHDQPDETPIVPRIAERLAALGMSDVELRRELGIASDAVFFPELRDDVLAVAVDLAANITADARLAPAVEQRVAQALAKERA